MLACTYVAAASSADRGKLYTIAFNDDGSLIGDFWSEPRYVDSDCDPDNFHVFTMARDGGTAELFRISNTLAE